MKRKTKGAAKAVIAVFFAFALFIAACLIEAYLRALQAEPIPVVSSNTVEARVSGSTSPDFLWVGTAWTINTDSKMPFRLEIISDSTPPRSITIPAGTHRIFYNHDFNNLADFNLGTEFRSAIPRELVVRPTGPN